ncbi:unnamed protein product [Arabidopsis lyrata]|nr:unnamed protein product [Arabidopsis lyrata]
MAFVSDEPSFHSEFCSAKFLACSVFKASLAGFISDVLVAISSGKDLRCVTLGDLLAFGFQKGFHDLGSC